MYFPLGHDSLGRGASLAISTAAARAPLDHGALGEDDGVHGDVEVHHGLPRSALDARRLVEYRQHSGRNYETSFSNQTILLENTTNMVVM